MNNIKIGVIADDFTGASDAASFLAKNGYQTILFTEIPKQTDFTCECMVIALKSRSIEPEAALRQVKEVLAFYQKIKVEKIYFKYCSTFDSTPDGNIGVVCDELLETMEEPYTLLCPSLPVNGRTMKDGILYVNGVPLSESAMRNHPLNPMWDSYIPNLMKPQSKYPCYILKKADLQSTKRVHALLEQWRHTSEKFYVVPDYENDEDAKKISELFPSLRLYSGGSGLLEYLLPKKAKVHENDPVLESNEAEAPCLIVCGSCSEMTGKQIQYYKNNFGDVMAIDAKQLLNKEVSATQTFETILQRLPKITFVYSDGADGNLDKQSPTFSKQAKAMETYLADLCELAQQHHFAKIIVGGGETSGAVTMRLGYQAYYIGKVIAPGVPTLIPVANKKMKLILKSGNFGKEDFFVKAVKS